MQQETHSLMDGKVHVYKRENSKYWQCSTYMDGRNHRVTTKEENLKLAIEFAREWYMVVYVNSKRRHQNARSDMLLGQFEPQPQHYETPIIDRPQSVRKSSGHTFAQAAENLSGSMS